MLSLFSKKKITDDTLTNIFVNGVFELVEKGFPDLAELLKNEAEFETHPEINENNLDQFLLIVITGNMFQISKYFDAFQQVKIQDLIYTKFAKSLDVSKEELKVTVGKLNQLFYRLNHPSKNTKYAMSKAFFHQYNLYEYQEEYFRRMKVPNPIILKKLNETMDVFMWDWEGIFKKYKVVFE